MNSEREEEKGEEAKHYRHSHGTKVMDGLTTDPCDGASN